MSTAVTGTALAYVLALGVAALFDVRERRIPNVLSAATASCGAARCWVTHGLLEAVVSLAAACLVVAVLWIPWRRGGLGGGDVKLAAAAAIGLPFAGLATYALATALVGGVLSVACYSLSSPTARASIRSSLLIGLYARALPAAPA